MGEREREREREGEGGKVGLSCFFSLTLSLFLFRCLLLLVHSLINCRCSFPRVRLKCEVKWHEGTRGGCALGDGSLRGERR